jgi:hypothetical protein
MPKILVLADSGFGKSSSIGKNIYEDRHINIKGLNPENTYIVSVTSKPLPFKGSNALFPVTSLDKIKDGKRVICKNAAEVEQALIVLSGSPSINIVIDDFNYLMQDWYMANALAKGWDAPKQIGFFMGKIFNAFELLDEAGKNVYVLAHGEEVAQPDGRVYLNLNTTGNMVDEYISPEGKFDVVLLGISQYDSALKKVTKQYLTNENEYYSSAKSAPGMFEDLLIPNDLGLVEEKINQYYNS